MSAINDKRGSGVQGALKTKTGYVEVQVQKGRRGRGRERGTEIGRTSESANIQWSGGRHSPSQACCRLRSLCVHLEGPSMGSERFQHHHGQSE